MEINLVLLGIWICVAFVFSAFSTMAKKEDMNDFLERFTFVGFFQIIIFLILTHFGWLNF